MIEDLPRDHIVPGYVLNDLPFAALSRTTLALFAGGSGDHNSLHIDIDHARNVAAMPDVIGHGMLTMAYLSRYVLAFAHQAQIRSLTTRFIEMSVVGDEITCRGKVADVQEANGEMRVSIELSAVRKDGKALAAGFAVVAL